MKELFLLLAIVTAFSANAFSQTVKSADNSEHSAGDPKKAKKEISVNQDTRKAEKTATTPPGETVKAKEKLTVKPNTEAIKE